MERKQRHSVEFCFIALCAVLFHKKLCDSCGELTEIVGGEDAGAVKTIGTFEGTPLKCSSKKNWIQSNKRIHVLQEP